MRHIGGHIDKIARSGFSSEFESLAPAHARPPAHHIDHAFEMPVMMRASLGIGVDGHRPGPDLLRSGAGMIDHGATVHAWRLRRVGVERSCRDHPHPVMFLFPDRAWLQPCWHQTGQDANSLQVKVKAPLQSSPVPVATCRCFPQRLSSIAAPAGRVSGPRLRVQSQPRTIRHSARSAPRSCARNATDSGGFCYSADPIVLRVDSTIAPGGCRNS